jgi:two-component system OmpR family response regulator
MHRSPHILLVEDDTEIAEMISRFLVKNGVRVSTATNGTEMDRLLGTSKIDLLLLDLMLPGEDGISICSRLRAASATPIVIVTARGADTDRIKGLEAGADDYLAKPFNPRELLARIRAVLRRSGASAAPGNGAFVTLTFEGWRVDPALRQLRNPAGVRVPLTGAEFDLLLVFCQHPRRVLTREQLVDLTRGRGAAPFERSVDILVSRIRQKIENDPRDPRFIHTVRLGGYLFTPEIQAA